MKLRIAALAILPALLAAAAPAPALAPAPDLVVLGVTSPNLDGGIVRVQVRNQGTADAAGSYIAVQLSGLEQGTTTIAMPAVAKQTTITVNVPTGKLLSQVHYTIILDRSNRVAESNERNNTFTGQFGGKP
ncbi:MAG TPA: CARDB domain-containing protein [Longimicrobium sp.]|nr:CARDB domain-containing protein [Longimicrobium sp.]